MSGLCVWFLCKVCSVGLYVRCLCLFVCATSMCHVCVVCVWFVCGILHFSMEIDNDFKLNVFFNLFKLDVAQKGSSNLDRIVVNV